MNAKRWISYLVVAGLAAGAGAMIARKATEGGEGPHDAAPASAEKAAGPCPGGAEPLYWKAPMDPSYIRDKPGKSPMGMDLVPVCPGEAGAAPEGSIRIDPATEQNIGVRMAPAERRDLARKIRAVGRVAYDERLVEHVHTKFQGWVEKLYVDYEGQEVKRGQPLLEIYSPELLSTQEELLLADRYRKSTEKSPFSDVSAGGEALFKATRRRLELWDIPDAEIRRLLNEGKVRKALTLYAPTDGVVTHLMVREGMEVGPSQNLYTIADLSRVWVYADVYEYELPWLKVGQKGTVELSYLPGKSFDGEVTYIYPFLDPKTRTARVRLELSNPGMVLKPEMFANVTLETEDRPGVIAVPAEAVLRSGKRDLVIVARGAGRFEPREVTLGMDSGDQWVEIAEGLKEGERVVLSSQFLFDSESKLEEAVQKLLSAADKGDGTDERPDAPAGQGEHAGGHAGHDMP